MKNLLTLIFALFCFSANAQTTVTLELWGGGCGVDNTAALNAYRSYININGATPLILKNCDYIIASQPDCFDQVAPIILGDRWYQTRLVKQFNGTYLLGVICIEGVKGTVLKRLTMRNAWGADCINITNVSGCPQGALLSIKSTSTVDASHNVLEDVSIDGDTSDHNYLYGIIFDGFPKTSGAIGIRTSSIRNLIAYGGIYGALRLQGTIAMKVSGYIGGPLIVVNSPSFSPAYLQIDVTNIVGNLSITSCQDCRIKANTISGNIYNDSNTINTWIIGRVSGIVTSNWVSSGVAAH